MATKTYSKTRVETEIQKIKRLFPNYETSKTSVKTSSDGKILKLKTSNPTLQAIMRDEGFTET